MSQEERREAILEARAANKKLADLITKGTKYHEPVKFAESTMNYTSSKFPR